MMPNSTEILEELDQRARALRFPVLDNDNVRFVAGRMRGFRLREDWGLVFEILVFSPGELAIVVDVYAFGPLVGPARWKLFQIGGVEELPGAPLWGEDGLWIKAAGLRRIKVAGGEIAISCDGPIPGEVELDAGECEDEIRFTRGLIRMIGLDILIPVHVLVDSVPALGLSSELFVLTNWDHPDISRGELPSESEALRAVAKVLGGEAESISYDHYSDNLDSPRWDEDD